LSSGSLPSFLSKWVILTASPIFLHNKSLRMDSFIIFHTSNGPLSRRAFCGRLKWRGWLRLLLRDDAQQFTVDFIRQHINATIGTLPHPPDTVFELQCCLADYFTVLKLNAANLPQDKAACKQVALPSGKLVACVECQSKKT